MAAKGKWSAPKFVRAGDPDELVREMIRNNLKNQIEYSYYNIGYQNGNWYAWYIADVSEMIRIRIEDLDG